MANRAEYTECGWDVLETQGTLIEWGPGGLLWRVMLLREKEHSLKRSS
jgi:hypothetical protein